MIAGGIGGIFGVFGFVSFIRTEVSIKRLKRRLQKSEEENNTLKKYLPKRINMERKDFIEWLEKDKI